LATTDRMFRPLVSDNPLAGLLRTQVLARIGSFAMSRQSVQRRAFSTVSQTGIQYRSSALSMDFPGLPNGAPQAGGLFPWMAVRKLRMRAEGPVEALFQSLDDRAFHLLVFGQSVPSELPLPKGALFQIQAIPADAANAREQARVGIPQKAFYLVRPDGYVGVS